MSIKINIDNIDYETRQQISKDLELKIEGNKYAKGQFRYVYPYDMVNDDFYLPFSYASKTIKLPRPLRKDFTKMIVKFEGKLRPEQRVVKKEALAQINKSGSVMISCHVGFGKCLGRNTPIMMYSGKCIPVQDIKPGQLIMGDDSTPRKIITTCTGYEQMYKVLPTSEGFEPYVVNKSHILSLHVIDRKTLEFGSKKYSVKWYNKGKLAYKFFKNKHKANDFMNKLIVPHIVDIKVKDYLKLPNDIKGMLKCYKKRVEYPQRICHINPYLLGVWLGIGGMKGNIFVTKYTIIIDYISKYLNCKMVSGKGDIYTVQSPTYSLYEVIKFYKLHNGNKHIPDSYMFNTREIRLELFAGIIDTIGNVNANGVYEFAHSSNTLLTDIVRLSRSLGLSSNYNKTVVVSGECLDMIPTLVKTPVFNQKGLLLSSFVLKAVQERDYYGFTIGGNRRFLLGDFTVTHNTIGAINLACTIRFKTLVIVNRIVLMKQWKESILQFCPSARVQCLTSKSKMSEADFYIINAINIKKMGRTYFSDIGLLVVDEAHAIMTEKLSKSMQFIQPRYLIGLTATPYRPDGLGILLDIYFGEFKIIRKLFCEHTVYKVDTGFKPIVKKTEAGRVDWNAILEDQATNEERNELIITIIKTHPKRNFIVLVKRVFQGHYLEDRLLEEKEYVTSLLETNQNYDRKARILVGTTGKISFGFDHKKMDTLILAADVESYYIQSMGRVFRKPDMRPLIFDLVDKNPILEKHYRTRRDVYKDAGGVIFPFRIT